MNRTSKEIIAVVASLFLAYIAWYGSYSPMRKAEIYISTLQGMQTNPISTLGDLEKRVSVPLDYPSPIGQEELVRNMANSVLGFVQQSHDMTSTAELVSFTTSYFEPILTRGKGMSFGQDIYLMGAINEMAFTRTGNRTYLEDAKKYYLEAESLGPNRPQALYGLFDIYRMEGDAADAGAIGNRILTNWPTDQNVQQGMAQLLSQSASSSAKKALHK
jgi:hypothetical protein